MITCPALSDPLRTDVSDEVVPIDHRPMRDTQVPRHVVRWYVRCPREEKPHKLHSATLRTPVIPLHCQASNLNRAGPSSSIPIASAVRKVFCGTIIVAAAGRPAIETLQIQMIISFRRKMVGTGQIRHPLDLNTFLFSHEITWPCRTLLTFVAFLCDLHGLLSTAPSMPCIGDTTLKYVLSIDKMKLIQIDTLFTANMPFALQSRGNEMHYCKLHTIS